MNTSPSQGESYKAMALLNEQPKIPRASSASLAANQKSADQLVRRKPTTRKKTWGIFYTPLELTRALTDWAVISGSDTILEPSFGGCGFLYEIARVLEEKGAASPWLQLCGCDKDLSAFRYLPKVHSRRKGNRRFRHQDFLATEPTDYCIQEFDVVMGNPPYVSRHNMRKNQLESVDRINARIGGKIPRLASLWAFFIVHSLQFLKHGGRMAWVLPRSLSQSDYGRKVVELLCTQFKAVTIVSVERRLFLKSGAEELIDVLLCSDHQKEPLARGVNPRVTYAGTLDEMHAKIAASAQECAMKVSISSGREEMLTPTERQAVSAYGNALGTYVFGDVAKIKIGIVTGATRFFVLKKSMLAAEKLTLEMCAPLLTKGSYVKGITWSVKDLEAAIESDRSVLLVKPALKETESYWAKFPEKLRGSIATFKKREHWNAPDDGHVPPAFFFGLVDNGPRLVLNDAGINCNNSVHRVFFEPHLDRTEIQAAALLMLSSYTQLSGELTGRVCGSGGLKFEPSDAYKLRLLARPKALSGKRIEFLWHRVDGLLREGKEAEAIKAIDNALLEFGGSQLSQTTVASVQQALTKLRLARKRQRVQNVN